MNPFFFGDSKSPLYGVFHPPTASPAKKEAILLCAPFGQEYMRSHRAFRQLATLLNKQGYPVLRFDYTGTGDSFGDSIDATISGWLDDITIACEELKHTAQASSVSIIGLRLGGLLASAACEKIEGIESLILWDTVTSGDNYIEELKKVISESEGSKSKYLDQEGNLHFNGFPLFKRQLEELRSIDAATFFPSAKCVVQICSTENERQKALRNAWSKNKHYDYQYVPAPGDWNFVDDFGGILLPQQIIQAIVSCFK